MNYYHLNFHKTSVGDHPEFFKIGNSSRREDLIFSRYESMKTVQESKISARTITYYYLISILGGGLAFGLNSLTMFTIVHEFLHAIPLILTSVPVIISETFTLSPYLLGLFNGVSWLSAVFPYLTGYIVSFAPVLYMVFRRKLSPFWLEFAIVSFVLTLLFQVIHLWAEFLVIPI
ncbi:MAG: hypothetical protein ACETWM_01275 [Candidatus Lokiarchaeia archaeon]